MERNAHYALVGLVSLLGIAACMLATLFTLPASLQVWGRQRHLGERG